MDNSSPNQQSQLNELKRYRKKRMTLSQSIHDTSRSFEEKRLSKFSSKNIQNHRISVESELVSSDQSVKQDQGDKIFGGQNQMTNFCYHQEGPLMIQDFQDFNEGYFGEMEESILKIQYVNSDKIFGVGQYMNSPPQQLQQGDSYSQQKSEVSSQFVQNQDNHLLKKYNFDNFDEYDNYQSQQSEKSEVDFEIQNKYNKKYKRQPFSDPYYVKLVDVHGIVRLINEIKQYQDNDKYLILRKIIVFILHLIPIIANIIIQHILFKLIMTFLILFNVIIFIYNNTIQDEHNKTIEQIIMFGFITEISLRIIAKGIIIPKYAFFRNFENIFDIILVTLYTLHITTPNIISIDISPLRLITLLLYLGELFDGLKVMLTALKQSFKFLLEALMIVGLFSIFFAINGVSLFQGLFNYRCIPETGLEEIDNWEQCNQEACPSGMICQYYPETIRITTSFNNVIYAYGQVLRTITMDDWSWVMFYTMRIFNPWIWIYYLLIIFVGGFFGFNLVIAVLKIHYAEATEEDQKRRAELQQQQELQNQYEFKPRDFQSIFDVAMLRYIGYFDLIQKYRNYLRTTISIQDYTLLQSEALTKGSQQPRLLSAKQQTQINFDNSFMMRLYKQLQQLNIKTLLLPKFSILRQKQQEINIKIYSDDPLELEILEKLQKFEFSQLSPYVNYEINQEYNSSADVLIKFDNLDEIRREQYERKITQMRNVKLPIEYPTFLETKQLKKKRISTLFPFLKTTRKHQLNILNQSQNQNVESNSQSISHITFKQQSDEGKNLSSSRYYDKGQKFAIKIKQKNYLLIQGYYCDYDEIDAKINQKLPKTTVNEQQLDFVYRFFREQELKQFKMVSEIWSGDDVIRKSFQQQKIQIFQSLQNPDSIIWMTSFKGKIQTAQKYCKIVVSSQSSQLFFDVIIFINFSLLAMQGILQDEIISTAEDITAVFLTCELLARLFSIPLREFAKNNNLIFEAIIVTINFIEFSLGDQMSSLNEQNFRLIRGTKSLLFYRCLQYNKMAMTIGYIAKSTFQQYIYLTFLMFLVIFLYALLGMEIYAGQFDQLDVIGQLHSYDNVLKSFMTIFNIMTNDDWYGVLVLGTNINLNFGVIYSYSMVIVLNYLTYGLVLAILLDGFGKYLDSQAAIQEDLLEEQKNQFESIDIMKINQIANKKQKINLIINLIKNLKIFYKNIQLKLYDGIGTNQSLYIFGKMNIIRQTCYKIVQNQIYKLCAELILYLSIISFALKTYHDIELDREHYPNLMQLICNIFFLIDFCINCIVKGVWMEKGSHITNIWQIMDIIYIISFFIQYSNPEDAKQIIKFFMFFGYFRAMKLMYQISWLEKIREALGRSLYDILNVLLTLLSVWVLFAVYAIILYQDQFGFCEDKMEFLINYDNCIQQNRTWINFKHNFDNITIAIPTLFVISTFDGWGEMMQIAENSQTRRIGPEAFNSYLHTAAFFIGFCFVGSMFFLSLFTGVLYSNLKTNQKKLEIEKLTQQQIEFKQITSLIMQDFPVFSNSINGNFQNYAISIITNSFLQKLMYFMIIINFIILLLFYFEMEDKQFQQLNWIHHILSLIQVIWVICTFLGLGAERYIDNYWRRFYLVLILFSLIDLFLDISLNWTDIYRKSTPYTSGYQFIRLFYTMRNLRIILIFQGLVSLQRLMRVMVFALPFLGKIFTILIITIFIFALIGCQLYGHIDKGQVMDDQINFQNLASALITLFKCASGDDWRTIMTDTMQHNPYCAEDPKYCGSVYNQLYFMLFMLLSNYVLLNLFVLGLIEQFESFFQAQNSIIQTYIENIDKIRTIWGKYSVENQGKGMQYKFLCKFLLDIGDPLGGSKGSNLWDVAKIASAFKLKSDHFGYIQYNQLVYELFRRCFHEDIFKQGSSESIKAIKQYNKDMQLRLMFFRRNKNIPRQNISTNLQLKANFNILHDYLTVLILFKTWESCSKLIMKKVKMSNIQYSDNEQIISQSQDGNHTEKLDQNALSQVLEIKKSAPICARLPKQQTLENEFQFENIPLYRENCSLFSLREGQFIEKNI